MNKTEHREKKVLVVGSASQDMIINLDKLPSLGETIGQGKFFRSYGGKGANQVVACAHSQAPTSFIACMGSDSNSQGYKRYLQENQVNTDYVFQLQDYSLGVALIFVDKNGNNSIGVAPEANNQLTPEVLKKSERAWKDCDIIVMQNEIPIESMSAMAENLKTEKKIWILNPAPAPKALPENVYSVIDYLIVNETEAGTLSGIDYSSDNVNKILEHFFTKGVKNIIITLGEKGLYFANPEQQYFSPAFKVPCVDTTGAGDVFVGAFAAALAKNQSIDQALMYAQATAALSTMSEGTQTSIPQWEQVLDFLKSTSLVNK